MSLRVLHLLWDGHLGGVQRYVANITSSSHWTQAEHGLCLFSQGGQVLNESDVSPLPLWCLGLKHGWQLRRTRMQLSQIVSAFQADVIHCHCDTPAFLLNINRFKQQRLVYRIFF